MLRVGLTGGIACGKTRVLRRLAQRGFHTLDLDALGRELTGPGSPALAEIVGAFGGSVLTADGVLDRKALAGRVFGHPEQLQRLNAILHPRLRAAEADWARSLEAERSAVLVSDGALLIETGAHLRFDRLLVVHCAPEQQLERLRARDGIDERAARARIDAQMPLAAKRAFAHHLIDASGSLDATDQAADAVADELCRLAERPAPSARRSLSRALGAARHGPRSGPRGLSPAAVLASIVEHQGPELSALAGLLSPAAAGPWYRAAETAAADAPAATLALPLVAWALARGAPDPPLLASAAHSLARLTHTEQPQLTDACLYALVLAEQLTEEAEVGDPAAQVARWSPLATRWGRGRQSPQLRAVWQAVARFPADPDAAAAACRRLGGEAALAGAVAGANLGAPPTAEPTWAEALRRLGFGR